jgi:carboxymethylenebutenolidase
MGFCLGGLMAFLSAAWENINAAVEYYGGRTEEFVVEAAHTSTPLLMHLAGEDEFMDKAAQQKIADVLAHNPPRVVIHTYAERNHTFARPHGHHYNAPDAELANTLSLAFLKEHLA